MNNENIIYDKEIEEESIYDVYMTEPERFFCGIYGALTITKKETREQFVEFFKYILVRDGHKWNELNKQRILQPLNALNNPDYDFKKKNLKLAYKSPLIFEYKGKVYEYEVMSKDEFDKLFRYVRDKEYNYE